MPNLLKFKFTIIFFLFISFCYAQKFTDISETSGVFCNNEYFFNIGGGVCVFDVNEDGYDDFFIPSGFGKNYLYLNNKDRTFTNILPTAFISFITKLDSFIINTAIAGDIDNDGDKDLFLASSGLKIDNGIEIKSNFLLKNNGDGTFTDISAQSGILNIYSYGESLTFGDYNLDGYLDIYLGSYIKSFGVTYDQNGNENGYEVSCRPNQLFLNNKNNTFSEVANLIGVDDKGCTLTAIFTDIDMDNDVDLLNANDFGEWTNLSNKYLKNNFPTNSFLDVSESSHLNEKMYGMGISLSDIDNNGYFDYYITNIGSNKMFLNFGGNSFQNVANSLNIDNTWAFKDSLRHTSWGCNFFDYDNDGDEDLFVNTGYVNSSFPPTIILDTSKFYENNFPYFTDITNNSGIISPIANRGSAYLDIDNDGDLDLISNHTYMQIFNSLGIEQNISVYQNNNINNNNFIKINLFGKKCNRDAIGSKVKIFIGNHSQIRELSGSNSHASMNSSTLHFGLGIATIIDSIEVIWIGGKVQKLYNISPNQTLYIDEEISTNNSNYLTQYSLFKLKSNLLTINDQITIINKLPLDNKSYSVTLYNEIGKLIAHENISHNLSSENMIFKNTILSEGIYYLIITNSNYFQNLKFIRI